MGARCIFGWLVAFVGFVGLYACRVKRLEVRKRKPACFIGFIGLLSLLSLLARFALVLCWLVLLFLLCCLCGLRVVLLVFLFPFGRYDKKKGRTVLARPFFVCCGLAMQNRAFRFRKIRNYWPLFLRLYIHQSMSVHNRFATA